MKKISSIIIFVSLLGGFIPQSKMLYSAEHSIGLYGYYAWWEPSFRNIYENYESDKNIMIMGPIYSVTFFNKLTLFYMSRFYLFIL